MKKCPYCAEEIQDEAIYCRYCENYLIDINPKKKDLTKQTYNLKNPSVSVVIVLLLIALIVAFILGKQTTLWSSNNQVAITTSNSPTPAITLALTPWPKPTIAPTPIIPSSLLLEIEINCNKKHEDRSTGIPGVEWSDMAIDMMVNSCIAENKNDWYLNNEPTPKVNQQLIGVANKDSLAIYDKPGIENQVVGYFSYGEEITLIGRDQDSPWVKCSQGWLLSTYVITTDGHKSTLPIVH